MKHVIHFARKLLPPTASFIYNQFTHHQQYAPVYVYCEDVDSAFTPKIKDHYPVLKAVEGKKEYWMYRLFRRLSDRSVKNTLDLIRNYDPAVYHFHYGVDPLVFLPFLNHLRKPSVVSFYGYDCTSFPKRFWGYGRELLRTNIFFNDKIDLITAMSPDMKRDLVILGCPEEKIVTHYHGIDTQPFRMNRNYEDKDKINLLMVSGLAEKKGHLFLLRAFRQASVESRKQLKLTIVGSGPMENPIREYIATQQMDNVVLKPAVHFGSPQHLEYLSGADIFVHPSITPENGDKEGIPGAVVEAMAAGLPVITTHHAGIPYVVSHDQTGWLVKENEDQELVQAIVELSHRASLRKKLGTEAQLFANQELDIHKKQLDLENIYHQAASRLFERSNKVEAG